jgi:hypothetical protein
VRGCTTRIALVGILAIGVGSSVRLRRPNDRATLHFFWLTVSFFGVLSFTPSGWYDHLDYFFEWADMVARLALPPLFLHFAFVFPERHDPWVRTPVGRIVLPLFYVPAFAIGLTRAFVMAGRGPHRAGLDLAHAIRNDVAGVPGGVSAGRPCRHGSCADEAAIGHGPPAAALDRLGIGARCACHSSRSI